MLALIAQWSWFSFWLILHILGVLVSLGPTFAFPILGAYAGRHPEHSAAIAHVSHEIERKLVLPVSATIPFLGLALIYTGHFDLWKSEWLIISIVLFVVAFFFAALVQGRNSTRLLEEIAKLPPGPPPPGSTGPPPQIAALTGKLQAGGMFLTVLLIAILVLMVWRPGNCQGVC
jgi:uncharacterized membrane protein